MKFRTVKVASQYSFIDSASYYVTSGTTRYVVNDREQADKLVVELNKLSKKYWKERKKLLKKHNIEYL